MKQEKLLKEFEKLSKTPYSDKNGVYWMGRKDGWDEAMMNAKPFLIKALTQARADESKKVLEEIRGLNKKRLFVWQADQNETVKKETYNLNSQIQASFNRGFNQALKRVREKVKKL